MGRSGINTQANKRIAAEYGRLLKDLDRIQFRTFICESLSYLYPHALMQHLFDATVKKVTKVVNDVIEVFDTLPFGNIPPLSGIIREYADVPLHKDCRLSSCLKFLNSQVYKAPPSKTFPKEPIRKIERRKSEKRLKDFEYKDEPKRKNSFS